jgi:hypothetical protein
MVNLIKDDFNEEPQDYNKDGVELDLEALKKYYLSLIEHSRELFDIGATSLAETFEVAYKVEKEKTINLLEMAFGLRENNKNLIGFNALLWKRIVTFLFTCSILCFLICAILICISFIK